MKRKVVAIIPVREFKNTKLRLGRWLGSPQRAALTISLLYRVLTALQHSKVQATVIVATDMRSTSRVAKKFKSLVIHEKRHHAGVSKAMEDGIAYALSHFTEATSFMLIPSDLPFLSRDAINEAISKLEDKDLVISPSMKRDGTSLLLFNFPRGKIPLHYDDYSYKRHLKEAKKLHVRYSIFPKKAFSFDVDSISDLRKLMKSLKAESVQEISQKLVSVI
jgi:2-phospho-L-lactate/phosphoenolpyruvate guanylyltransferase